MQSAFQESGLKGWTVVALAGLDLLEAGDDHAITDELADSFALSFQAKAEVTCLRVETLK